MPKFRATVQLIELDGADPVEVRQGIEGALTRAGLARWRILSIERERPQALPGAPPPMPPPVRQAAARQPVNLGGLLLIAAVGWVLWLFWALAG
jgi:hypothetical protein